MTEGSVRPAYTKGRHRNKIIIERWLAENPQLGQKMDFYKRQAEEFGCHHDTVRGVCKRLNGR